MTIALPSPSPAPAPAPPPSSRPHLELLFHGTGNSSGLPYVTCLTSAERVEDIACRSCRETVDGTVNGARNERGNVGCVVRRMGEDGRWRNILIDAGKTFRHQAIKFFRKHSIQRIDAVILTHGHSDAINGMDDLRAWTMRPSPQVGQAIPVYVSAATLSTITEQFPYMVDTKRATGGGDVPSLQFRVFEEGKEFMVEGVRVMPLAVHHGRYFTPPTPVVNGNGMLNGHGPSAATAAAAIHPFLCNGFIFDGLVTYLSDINHMPPEAWDTMVDTVRKAVRSGEPAAPPRSITPGTWSVVDDPQNRPTLERGQLPYLVLDALFLREHPSHLSFLQALKCARDIDARRTLLVGFTHPTSHAEWLSACRRAAREGGEELGEAKFWQLVKDHARMQGMETELEEVGKWGGCVRPAWDGQRVGVSVDGELVRYGGEDDEEW